MLEKASSFGVLAVVNDAEPTNKISEEDLTINSYIYEAFAATPDDSLTADNLVALTLETGECGVKVR